MLAFVISMTFMPMMSHAMTLDGAESAQTEISKGHQCHHHGEAHTASEKTSQNDKDHSGKCCDKGMCKCVGSNCHSLSKIFDNGNNSLSSLSNSGLVFAFDNELAASAFLEGLKRPPRA